MADAVSVALAAGAAGVLVVCAGQVHAAAHVQKIHPYRVNAFDSGEAGPLAMVEEGQVRSLCVWPQPGSALGARALQQLRTQPWPRVELLYSHADAGGHVVRALLADAGEAHPLRGIVVAGTGNGTIHRALETALREAQQCGVQVVRVSRCAHGQVVGSDCGSFPAYGLSAVKARIALQLEIAARP